MLTVGEVARRLAVSRAHVGKLITTGQLKATDVSAEGALYHKWRIDPAELDRFMRERSSFDPEERANREIVVSKAEERMYRDLGIK